MQNDTGSSATDGLTSDGTVRVSGVQSDGQWQYRFGSNSPWQTGTGDTVALPAGTADGTVRLEVQQTSAAGVFSPVAALEFTLDTTAQPFVVALSNDTGALPDDGLTSDAALTLSALEPGAQWHYRVDGSQIWTPGSGTTLPATLFTQDGPIQLDLRQTDAAGNTREQTVRFVRDTQASPVDLIDADGVQDAAFTVVDTTEFHSGVRITRLTGDLTTDALHTLRLHIAGAALDTATDEWVLDRAVSLAQDASASPISLGGVSDISYRFDAATRELMLWKADGTDLTGAEATQLTNAIELRSTAPVPSLGERIVTVSQTDRAGNTSAAATVTIDHDPRLPLLDLNGPASGRSADNATATLAGEVRLFDAGLTVGHENPDGEVASVRMVLTGTGASRDDHLLSTRSGTTTALDGPQALFSVDGVDWQMQRRSDTFTLSRADGDHASQAETQAMLDSLRVQNTLLHPLQGTRTFTVTLFDGYGRITSAAGTVVYDTQAPVPDLNGGAAGVNHAVAVSPGLPWAFAISNPATAAFVDRDRLTTMTLKFGSGVAGAFNTVNANAAEWIGFFDEDNGTDRSGMLRLGDSASLTRTDLIAGKAITLRLAAGTSPTLTVQSDSPLTPDEASALLRDLRYTTGAAAALGTRTVEVAATDRAGNTTLPGSQTVLDVRPIGTPVLLLSRSADTGLHHNDGETSRNGSATAPLTLSGFAPAGAAVTVFRDNDGNGALGSGESVATVSADAGGRWSWTLSGSALADGSYRFGAVAGGKTSSVAEITIDTRPPASTFALGESVQLRPLLTGTSDAGMAVTVEVDTDNDLANGYEVRYATRTDETSRWVIDTASAQPVSGAAVSLAPGDVIHARVTSEDVAGNTTVRTATSVAQTSVYAISDSHVIEGTDGSRELVYRVTRTGDLSHAGQVAYAVDSASSARAITGGALADNDYSGAASGTVSFAAGQSSALIRFNVYGDAYREVNDRLLVRLSQPTEGSVGDGLGIGNINEIDVAQLQAAYGLRDLDPRANDFAIRVRRSSDNAEQDIGFTADGMLDRQALRDFVGTGADSDGFVTRWYDQSGHGRDMLQTDATRQGLIVDDGQVITRADGSTAISFNAGRNGANNDYMIASGVAATDWRSVAIYAKVQSEGAAPGSLFNLGQADEKRLSSHYPDNVHGYVWDVNSTQSQGRLTRPIAADQSLTGKANDIVFEAHSGNTSAGTAAMNYTDARQAIFENGVRVTSDDSLISSQISTTAGWKLAWHGQYGNQDSMYYQQVMVNEFLIHLAKDNSTPVPQSLLGTAGADVLTYAGEAGLTRIDGLGGVDTLYLSGNASLDPATLSGGMTNIEQVWMDNGSANQLTLSYQALQANAASTLTVTMDAGDALILAGQRFDHDALRTQAVIVGSSAADRVVGTGGNDQMIGDANADTFTWLQDQGGHDTVRDYTAAQSDRLDLTLLLQGFKAGDEDLYLHKVVENGSVTLQVDWDGSGTFDTPDLTITLLNVLPTDAITVLTGAGTSVL